MKSVFSMQIPTSRREVTPQWLQHVLQNTFNTSALEVLQMTDGGDTGMGFGVETVKVIIQLTDSTGDKQFKNLIVKYVPEGVDTGAFLKESLVYLKLFPSMEQWQKQQLSDVLYEPAAPRCYFTLCDQNSGVMVLEDLDEKGYSVFPNVTEMDIAHVRLAVAELARFHAMSVAMSTDCTTLPLSEHPDLAFLKPSISKEQMEDMKIAAPVGIQAIINQVASHPKSKDMINKLETLKTHTSFVEALGQSLAFPRDPILILHGDFWNNNLKFSYDLDGHPCDVKMTEFQNCRFGTQTDDLSFFMYTSTSADFRSKHSNEILQCYHSAFLDHLKKMQISFDHSELSLEMLKNQLDASMPFGLISSIIILPMILEHCHMVNGNVENGSMDKMNGLVHGGNRWDKNNWITELVGEMTEKKVVP